MKLFKEFITPDNQIAPPAELIAESDDVQILQRQAEALSVDEGALDIVWSTGDPNETDILLELPVKDQYRLVIRR